MNTRINYEMTEDQLKTLLAAMRPVPLIALQCGMPCSPQENANAAWARLGKDMGFDPMTVRPTGKGDRFFSAVAACVGVGCGAIDGVSHSNECIAEHAATVDGMSK